MPSVTHVFFVVVPVDVIYSLFFLNVFAASSFAAKIMTIINNTRLYLYRYPERQQAGSVGPTLGIPIPKNIPKVSMLCPCFRNFFLRPPSLCSRTTIP